jgi:hypothetical protein
MAETVTAQVQGSLPLPEEEPVGFDLIQEASEESFPASDAPSWTSVTGIGSRFEERKAGKRTVELS